MKAQTLDFLRGAVTHLRSGIRHADDATFPSALRGELQQRGAWELAWARDDLSRAADLLEAAQGPNTLVADLRNGSIMARDAARQVGSGQHVSTAALDTARADAMRAIWALGAPA